MSTSENLEQTLDIVFFHLGGLAIMRITIPVCGLPKLQMVTSFILKSNSSRSRRLTIFLPQVSRVLSLHCLGDDLDDDDDDDVVDDGSDGDEDDNDDDDNYDYDYTVS